MAFPNDGKKFEPGKSGNPEGRPKKLPDIDILLGEVLSEERDGLDAAKAILLAIRNKAFKGDIRAAEMLFDRAYGKPKQFVDTSLTLNDSLIIELEREENDDEHAEV